VLIQTSTLIHRIALWLDSMYFRKKTLSAAARSAPKSSVWRR